MTRSVTSLAAGLAIFVLASGCSDSTPGARTSATPSPTSSAQHALACAAISSTLVKSVQSYIDTFGPKAGGSGGASPSPSPTPTPSASSGSEGGVTAALAEARTQLGKKGCDLNEFRTRFTQAMTTVRARGPVAKAVLLRLTSSMSGTLGTAAVTRKVKPGQDLEVVASHLATGSTLVLGAGTYRLRRALVLLAGITLRGAGRARTTVTSRASGSDVLVLTDGEVRLRGLTLEHLGKKSSSVLVGGPSSKIVLADVRITGAGGRQGSGSGSGVSMTAAPASRPGTTTTLEVTNSDISGNAGAGVLLSGGHRASIRSSRFRHDGQCGVCFAGASSGAVRNSSFDHNAVGVAVLGTARPLVRDSTFIGGLVGIQVSDRAEPEIRDVRITGSTRAAVIFGKASSGRVGGVTCTQVPYGIVVAHGALPLLGKNSCTLARSK